MGIRFFCPNGHKLNVKEFQAGRLGICPFCGARIQIPTQSTRPISKSSGRQSAAQAAIQTLGQDDPESTEASDSSPDILPGEPPSLPGDPTGGKMLGPSIPVGTPSGSGPIIAPPALSASGRVPAATPAPTTLAAVGNLRSAPVRKTPPGPSQAGKPDVLMPPVPFPVVTAVPTAPLAVPGPSQPTVAEPTDPIALAPEMIWYVRPPSGGQFGPASGDLMRGWLSEGRVSADSLVWREGWRDWQEAGTVFPKLRSNQMIDFLETTPVATVADAPTSHVHRPKVHRSSDRSQIALLVVLSLAVIVLLFVFLWVLLYK